jgi:chemotaxis protein methyltransferase CheR
MNQETKRIVFTMRDKYEKDISAFGPGFLAKTIQRRLSETGLEDIDAYCAFLTNNAEEADTLNRSLLISYSVFFRESMTFSMLEDLVFPSILNERKKDDEIRIWSVGCASGQEAYSMAILLEEISHSIGKAIRYRICATDISESELALGTEGVYDYNALLNVKLKHLDKYFAKNGKSYAISPDIKRHIHFSNYDIRDEGTGHPPECIYGDFDLVMCSNLLIYYNPDQQRSILKKLHRSLAPKGYLVIGEAERLLVETNMKLFPMTTSSTIFENSKRRNLP